MSRKLPPSAVALLSASVVAVPTLLGPGLAQATAPGANGTIAYVGNKDGNDDIYAINPDGTGNVDLTRSPANETDPAYSPGGTKIAYVSDRDGNWDIWEMYSDGSGQTQITRHSQSDRYPTWSPDGAQIAYRSNFGGTFNIHVMNADGSGDRIVARDASFNSEPSWSPDGATIAFVSDRVTGTRQIWAVSPDGSNLRQLTSGGTNRFPSWSPDGRTIDFISDRDGYEQLYAMAADGSNQHRLLVSHHSDRYPVASPDGTLVAFRSSNTRGQQAIFLMNADASNVHQVTQDSARDIQPSWQTVPLRSGDAPIVDAPITSVLPPRTSSGASAQPDAGTSATGGTGPDAGLVRLSLIHLRATPKRFSTAIPASCTAHPAGRSCRALHERLGTTLRFTLSGRAKVAFTLWTRVHGKKRVIGSFTRTAAFGENRVRFSGRVHARALASGAYSITAVAGRGARRSRPASVRLAVRNR